MPLYLIHGFRWTRAQIRVFIILNNLEDATADYIQTPATIHTLRTAIFQHHPDLRKTCPDLTFVEQHDPEDLRTGAQPFAFVADTVREAADVAGIGAGAVGGSGGSGENGGRRKDGKAGRMNGAGSGVYGQGLSMDVGAAMGRGGGIGGETWDAMADLRDEIAKDEIVGWFAVWNGDVERRDLGEEGDDAEEEDEDEEGGVEEEEKKKQGGKQEKDVDLYEGSANRSPTTASTPNTRPGREGRNGGYIKGNNVHGASSNSGRQGSGGGAAASGDSQVRDEDIIEADNDDDDDEYESGGEEDDEEASGSAFTDDD